MLSRYKGKRILTRIGGRAALFALSLVAACRPVPVPPAPTSVERQIIVENISEVLYRDVRQAIVEIIMDGQMAGSGCILDPSGLIMTAEHVVGYPGRKMEISSPYIGRLPVRIIAVDGGRDLALLRAPRRTTPYPYLDLSDQPIPPGHVAFLLGAPQYRHNIMIRGAVASDRPSYEWLGDQGRHVEILYFSANTPKGMSGGPWFDLDGRVIGLQSSMMTNQDAMVGIAFVVDVRHIRHLLQSQITTRTPALQMPVEEIWEHHPAFLQRFPPGMEGLIARSPVRDGPADLAGLRDRDAIIAVDGQPITYRDQMMRAVRSKQPGDPITVTIQGPDNDGLREVTITLGCLEDRWLEANVGR